MKLSASVTLVLIAMSAWAQLQPQSDSVAWGSAVNGLRLGAVFGSDPAKPTIRVVFQNVSGQDQEVVLGYENGRDPAYSLKFIAKAPDGKLREGLGLAAYYPGEGLLKAVSLALPSARRYELVFTPKDIICSSRIDTLEGLLKAGYSVRVVFETDNEALAMAGPLPHPWVGKVESAEISMPR